MDKQRELELKSDRTMLREYILKQLANDLTDDKIDWARKTLPEYWIGYNELKYDRARYLFSNQIAAEVMRNPKQTIKETYDKFLRGSMFVDRKTRYGRNAAKGMEAYSREQYVEVSEYIGVSLKDAEVKVIDEDEKIFEYRGPNGTVRVRCTRGMSPGELLALANKDAYIVEYL